MFDREFSSRLLYSATLNTITLTLEDLPTAEARALDAVEQLQGPTGDAYILLTERERSNLHRYKLAMSIYLDRWVQRTDVVKVIAVLQAAKSGEWSSTLSKVYTKYDPMHHNQHF